MDNAFGRPHRYDALVSFRKDAVFRRRNIFGDDFNPRKR